MGSYQLTLSPNYVPNWGMNEALRELFQNGIDRENESEGACKFSITYDPLARRLTLGNPDTYLHKRSLLLGETTKDGKTTIGKYGEGYKLALLVLLRMGCRVTILNQHEVWIPKLVKSRVFDAELIQIDTMRSPNKDTWLRYVIDGVTPEHYAEFQSQCLMFHTVEKFTFHGSSILLEKKFAGKVYCNSLFVCDVENLVYGYDLKPESIELDRDRKKVSTFNLTWETSRLWAEFEGDQHLVYELTKNGAQDVAYYNTHVRKTSKGYEALCEMHADEFLKAYGVNAVVCSSNEEAELIKKRYKNLVPVILPQDKYHFISNSGSYTSRSLPSRDSFTPENWVKEWVDQLKSRLGYLNQATLPSQFEASLEAELVKLIDESKKWGY